MLPLLAGTSHVCRQSIYIRQTEKGDKLLRNHSVHATVASFAIQLMPN